MRFVLITHEHADHTSGLEILLKKSTPEVFVPKKLLLYFTEKYPEGNFTPVILHRDVQIDQMTVTGFQVPHDSRECYGYRVETDSFQLGFATDLGRPLSSIEFFLSGTSHLILESNYDLKMLIDGKYPEYLKQRILSSRGHLDNDDTLRLLSKLKHPGLKKVMLAHLSKENNRPEIVFQKFCDVFKKDLEISVASRTEQTVLYENTLKNNLS